MDDLIEQLSDAVHQGWMREKWAQGFARHTWCYGVECSKPQEQHHPDMLPYADLSEPTRNYDRATVRAVVAALAEAGYQIVPISANEETPSRG